jgi:hypothetical protein
VTTAVASARTTPVLVRLLLVPASSAVLGGATSFLQTFLPDALRPFANSASGWTLLAALAVASFASGTVVSAIAGAASFAALVVGYQAVSTLRGFPTDETLFLVVGLVVGPFVGIATSWTRRNGVRAALGGAVLCGIAVGESAYGLIVISGTTGWFYWALIGVVGLVLLGCIVARRLQATGERVLLLSLTCVVGTLFFVGYDTLGQLIA